METKAIVTTTINPPTEALRKFAAMPGWFLIVAGDTNTPSDWHLPGVIYLSPSFQTDYDKKLSDAIGWKSLQRRNFALLYAHSMGSDVVAVVDDDNIPYDDWGTNLMIGREVEVNCYTVDAP